LVPSSDTSCDTVNTNNLVINITVFNETLTSGVTSDQSAAWLFCVALGSTILLLAFHGFLSIEHDYYFINHYVRCACRIIFGVLIILLPNINFGINLSGLLLIGVVATIILLLSLIEIIGTLPSYNEYYGDWDEADMSTMSTAETTAQHHGLRLRNEIIATNARDGFD